LLLTLYNSGARVSGIIALRREQVQLDAATGAHLELHGKGRKDRVVPLWAETARVLRAWFREQGGQDGDVAFPSARGRALSRDGVDRLLRRAVASAVAYCPSLAVKSKREPTPKVDGAGVAVQAVLAARASLQFQGRSSLSLLARWPLASWPMAWAR